MFRNLVYLTALTALTGCLARPVAVQHSEPETVTAVGYGAMSAFHGHPLPQQRLLAMRAARLDALRSLAEEVYGTRVRGATTVQGLSVEHDGYRASVDAVVRGARLVALNAKGDGVYEAVVQTRFGAGDSGCGPGAHAGCLVGVPDGQWPMTAIYAAPAHAASAAYPQVRYFPQAGGGR